MHYYDDWACTDDDWACTDDDLACVDADDAVCDDYRDGLLPQEAEIYEREKALFDFIQYVLWNPYEFGLSYKIRNTYIHSVGYYR